MDSLVKVQENLKFRIKRGLDNFKKSPKERKTSVDYLKCRLKLLEDLWTQFSQTHTQLVKDSKPEEFIHSVYISKNVYEETEELYIECKYLINATISKINPSSIASSRSATDSSTSSNKVDDRVRLPKISIPMFSGQYSEWVSFRDLFVSLIHKNKSLDDVQKLHYLKSHLTGEAEQLLRHVPITQENYSTSWEQLESRYNNKKYLSNCILKRLLSQRNLTTESASALKELSDTTNECLKALKNLGIDIKSWDIIIVHLICLKLDDESRKQWELKSSESGNELPTFEQFKRFLETRFRALEFLDPNVSRLNNNVHEHFNVPVHSKVHHVVNLSCAYCSDAHTISHCKQFSKSNTDARRGFVQSHNLCYNCLGFNHSVYSCRQSHRCRICHRKHHSLLHPKNDTPTIESQVNNHSVVANVVLPAVTSHSSFQEVNDEFGCNIKTQHISTNRDQVLLPTALVNATAKSGKIITLRCLLDQGSQASVITESAVQRLGLRRTPSKSTISGLGSDKSAVTASKSMVSLTIQSLLNQSFKCEVNAFVLNKLTSVLPERRIDVQSWSEFAHLKLADPLFNQPNTVDLLLGADIYGKLLLEGVMKGSPGAATAQNTAMGWILSGPILKEKSTSNNSIRLNHVTVSSELLKQQRELEAGNSIILPKDGNNIKERRSIEVNAITTKQSSNVKYKFNLPFRKVNPQLKERHARMSKYQDLNCVKVVPNGNHNKPEPMYLPHSTFKNSEKHKFHSSPKMLNHLRLASDSNYETANMSNLKRWQLTRKLVQDLRQPWPSE